MGDGELGPDIQAQVEAPLLGALAAHRQTTDVRITATMVEFFIGGELVESHPVVAGQAERLGLPAGEVRFHMRTRAWCRRKAAGIGPSSVPDRRAARRQRLYRLRAAQGVIGLADKHDPSRLEAACAKAITAGDPSYRTVRGILTASTEQDQLPAAAGDGGAAAFLRGPASFANVIPLPGTIPTNAVTPAAAEGASS